MTLTPTHLSLESILLWTFIPASERERFQNKKRFFWLVVAFSVLPDLDAFLGIHRGISHSILFPMILVIIGTFIYYHYHYNRKDSINSENTEEGLSETRSEEFSFFARCVAYIGILWLIHIILDMDYPLAIFFPLSDRLYQLDFVIFFDVLPWLIFPAMIVGMGFEITGLTYLRGISTYFVNLPPSIREEIWGHQPQPYYINDFFIHGLLFLIFLMYVARPMVPRIEWRHLSEWPKKIRFDGPIMGLGVVLVVMGFMLGPMIGTHTIDTDSINGSFQVSKTVFSPTMAIAFETTNYLLQPDTLFFVKGSLTTNSVNDPFDQVLLMTTQKKYNNFSNGVSQLFKQYPLNTSENILAFEPIYQNLLDELYTYSLAMNLTNQNETRLNTQLLSGSFALVSVIESWNSDQILNGTHQFENVQLAVTITSNRLSLMFFGMTSIIVGILVSFFSVRVKKSK